MTFKYYCKTGVGLCSAPEFQNCLIQLKALRHRCGMCAYEKLSGFVENISEKQWQQQQKQQTLLAY